MRSDDPFLEKCEVPRFEFLLHECMNEGSVPALQAKRERDRQADQCLIKRAVYYRTGVIMKKVVRISRLMKGALKSNTYLFGICNISMH